MQQERKPASRYRRTTGNGEGSHAAGNGTTTNGPRFHDDARAASQDELGGNALKRVDETFEQSAPMVGALAFRQFRE